MRVVKVSAIAAALVAIAATAATAATPNMDVLMTAYRGEALAPTTDATQIALCPTWARTPTGIQAQTDSRVDASRSEDFGLVASVTAYRSLINDTTVDTTFPAEYSAARTRRSDLTMPPATALIATQGDTAATARLFLERGVQAATGALPGSTLPATLPPTSVGATDVPVTLTLPPNLSLPANASDITLPGGVKLTVPGQATLPPGITLPSGVQTTLPGVLSVPPELASQIPDFTTPDFAKLLSSIAATAIDQATLPGGTLPGDLTLPPALSGDLMPDIETMMKGEVVRASVARRRMRVEVPSCFAAVAATSTPMLTGMFVSTLPISLPPASTRAAISTAAPLPGATSTPAITAAPAGVLDVSLRLVGSAFAQLMTAERRPALEAAVTADLATLMGVAQQHIVLRSLRIGSLIVDFTVASGADVNATTAQARAASAATSTAWISAVQASYSTVSSEQLTAEVISAAPGTPAPATVALAPATTAAGGLPRASNSSPASSVCVRAAVVATAVLVSVLGVI